MTVGASSTAEMKIVFCVHRRPNTGIAGRSASRSAKRSALGKYARKAPSCLFRSRADRRSRRLLARRPAFRRRDAALAGGAAFAGADDAAIAAELKALFGDAAELCAHINDDEAPEA